MNFKTKLTKKAISLLLLVAMILTLSANIGFSAFATEQQEIDFCVDKMKNLPTDSEFLNETLKLPNKNELKKSREKTIKHSDKTEEDVTIDEQEVYEAIKEVVKSLTDKFDIQQSAKEILNFASDGENLLNSETEKAQKASKLSANIQKANAIYRWVALNIHYDHESFDAIANPGKTSAERKPQDAYFVFAKKTGVCEGYARLLNLMMRIAKIPCMYICSICGPDKDYGHAFNAIYINEESENRKGWTLLDSTWASPNSDGDEGLKKFLSGESYFGERTLEDALATANDYTKVLYDEFKDAKNYWENPNQKLIDDFNKKSPEILKKLNEKYKDSSHFETIEFFDRFGSLWFKYKTNLTMEQAKQVKDQLKELNIRRNIGETVDVFTGKLEIYCSECMEYETFADLKKEDFDYKQSLCFHLSPYLERVNSNDEKVQKYCDELQQMYVNTVFPNLKDIEGNMDKINSELSDKLKELNKKYDDIITIKKVQLGVEKNDLGYEIVGNFEVDLSSEEIQTKARKHGEECDESKATLEQTMAEFFPAYYHPQKSLEEANENIICHKFHKISQFEDGSVATRKINMIWLPYHYHEGKAVVGIDHSERFKEMTISDSMIKIDDQEYNRFGYEIHCTNNCENLMIEGHVKTDIINVKNATIRDNVAVTYIYNVENLTIEGDATIDLNQAFALKNIDTTKSNKYHAENGILYEKVDGKKGKEIGEIFTESRENGDEAFELDDSEGVG